MSTQQICKYAVGTHDDCPAIIVRIYFIIITTGLCICAKIHNRFDITNKKPIVQIYMII